MQRAPPWSDWGSNSSNHALYLRGNSLVFRAGGVGEMPLALASSFLTKLGGAVNDAEGAPEPVTEAPVAATSGTDVPMMTQRWNCLSVAFLDSAEEVIHPSLTFRVHGVCMTYLTGRDMSV